MGCFSSVLNQLYTKLTLDLLSSSHCLSLSLILCWNFFQSQCFFFTVFLSFQLLITFFNTELAKKKNQSILFCAVISAALNNSYFWMNDLISPPPFSTTTFHIYLHFFFAQSNENQIIIRLCRNNTFIGLLYWQIIEKKNSLNFFFFKLLISFLVSAYFSTFDAFSFEDAIILFPSYKHSFPPNIIRFKHSIAYRSDQKNFLTLGQLGNQRREPFL